MEEATFVFHALFPDSAVADGACLLVFDAEFSGHSLSHQIARVRVLASGFEVSCELPFLCPDFAAAAETYYQLMMNHGQVLSPSGPKGLRLRDNVFRGEWRVRLKATAH